MDNQLTPYSAYFKLYDGRRDNLQISFNVTAQPDENSGQFIAKYQELVTMLFDLGLSSKPAGLEEGERIQEVDGWVLGETASSGQPCVYLYKSPLEWKVATVYQEKIELLPIDVNTNGKRWDGAAPTREQAEKKKVIQSCQFKIVMADTGKTSDKGNKIYRFDRIYGTAAKAQEKDEQAPVPDTDEDIDSYPDVIRKLSGETLSFVKRARATQEKHATKTVDPESLTLLIEIADEALKVPGSGEIVLSILSGVEPIDLSEQFSEYLAKKLLQWVPTHIEDEGKIVENTAYNEKAVKAMVEVWLTAKKYAMIEDA